MHPVRLVILGEDGLLYLAEARRAGSRVTVAFDLLARPETGREILSPVWGPGGAWVAWSESDGVGGRVRVMDPHGESLHDLPGFPAFCLDPSPDGSRLAMLSAGPLGLELLVLDLASGATSLVGRGAPLYWSWAPSGKRLALHVGNRVAIADLAVMEGTVVEHDLMDPAGRFLAPWWSPAGGELILGDPEEGLVAVSLDGSVVSPISEGRAGVRFAVDPSGQRVAMVVQHGERSRVEVVDRLSGRREVAVDEPVAAMWWSPDGVRLATLVAGGRQGEPLLRWRVWGAGSTIDSPPFRPTRVLAETVLPFFEQFSFAHRVFSSDGRWLAVPTVTATGRSDVVLYGVEGGDPVIVGEGVLAWCAPSGTDPDGRP